MLEIYLNKFFYKLIFLNLSGINEYSDRIIKKYNLNELINNKKLEQSLINLNFINTGRY